MASATQRTMRLVGSWFDSSGIGGYSSKPRHGRTVGTLRAPSIIRNGEQAQVRAPAPVQPSRRRAPALPALARQRRVHGPRRFAQGTVREVFVTLWEEGLISRGHRVIHWCPHCRTALSDEEAEFADEMGTLYYIRYPVEGGPQPFLTVATARPETMLGDTAVAVHPRDKRHAGFIGKTARLPIADVPIPIIADEAVDPKFGTGFVKVTPAHDANDFEIGLRHHLPMPLIMREDGSMGEEAGTPKGLPDGRGEGGRVPPPLQGLDRFEARERIVQMLRAQGLLEKAEPHQHAVRHCYRCDTVVEPRLSDQWFVKMRPLAEPALAAYRSGEIRLVPKRWGATYEHWMENIRDWNISLQLWWGHRISVLCFMTCRHQWADREDPTRC